MSGYKSLGAYQKAFQLAMEVFHISKRFPKDETFGLTNQIRRCSRSTCANFAEAYRKRNYKPYFISKITDCDAENAEVGVWLDFAFECSYITIEEFKNLTLLWIEVGKLLGDILKDPDKYR